MRRVYTDLSLCKTTRNDMLRELHGAFAKWDYIIPIKQPEVKGHEKIQS